MHPIDIPFIASFLIRPTIRQTSSYFLRFPLLAPTPVRYNKEKIPHRAHCCSSSGIRVSGTSAMRMHDGCAADV